LNLDTIRNLDSNKTYYLSNTTGEVKEAGLWQKIKCAFGVKSALRKVTDLVEAVRTSLLQEAGINKNDALDEDIRRSINLNDSIKGSVLKDLVNRFTADEQTITQSMANKAVQDAAKTAASQFIAKYPGIGDHKALTQIFAHALKPVLNGEIPLIRQEGKQPQLNKSVFIDQSVKPITKEIASLLLEASQNPKLGQPKIDKVYAKHILATLFNEDGTRNQNGINDLKTQEEARLQFAFQLGEKIMNTRPHIVHSLLQKMNVDPLTKLNSIMGYCEGDKELEEIVLNVIPALCLTSNNDLRTEKSIKAKIDAIKDNLNELRALGYNKSKEGGVPQIFKIAIINLDGGALPKGMLTRMHEELQNIPLDSYLKLKGFSTADEVFMALDATQNMIERVIKNVNPDKLFREAGENEAGGPHANATRITAMGMLLSRLNAQTRQRMVNAFTSSEASKMLGIMTILERDMHVASNTVYTEPAQRDFLKQRLIDGMKIHDLCLETLGYAQGTSLPPCEADEYADVNEGSAIEIRLRLDEIWENSNAN